jgi:hypothetical protein
MRARAFVGRLRVTAAEVVVSTPTFFSASLSGVSSASFLFCIAAIIGGCGGGSTSTPTPPPPTPSATHLSVTTPATATSGISFSITVTALDSTGATVNTDNGTVVLSSSDTRAAYGAQASPDDSRLTLSHGAVTTTVTLYTAAAQTITATDSVSSSVTGTSGSITVGPAQFTAVGNMSVPHEFHTATLLEDGTVLVAGGDDGTNPTIVANIFDPATGMFTSTGSLATARQQATAVLLTTGQVLIAGGFGANGQALNSAELYDPKGKTFSPAGNMAVARGQHTATTLQSGKILVVGGASALSGGTAIATAELYNPGSGTFSAAGTMATARTAETATLLGSGMVLIAGGNDLTSGPLNTAELFDPTIVAFATVTATMTATRASFTATLLPDGKVLLAGGDNLQYHVNSPATQSTGELFDPVAAAFTSIGSMTEAREGHTATLLLDGTVLIVGGNHLLMTGGTTRAGVFPRSSATTELFQESGGSSVFTVQQSLNMDRTNHTATLLPGGKVLVTGGSQYLGPLQNPPTKVTLATAEELE